MSDATIRVLIADDHPPARAGIRSSLEAAPGFEVVAEVGDAASAVNAAATLEPDVCLLDINMPGSGLKAIGPILEAAPRAAVVMLTVSRDDDDLFAALRAGASGYLLKDTDPDRLSLALRGVLSGEAALPRTLVTRLIGEFQDRDRRRSGLLRRKGIGASLTAKEWEVLELMKAGRSTAEIADRLAVAQVTIRSHVAAILRKLQVKDRRAAIALVTDDEAL